MSLSVSRRLALLGLLCLAGCVVDSEQEPIDDVGGDDDGDLGYAAVAPFTTRFGMFYVLWHCDFASGNPWGFPIHNIANAIAGVQPFGPVGAWHWWQQPRAGYYCLTQNDALLRQHAEMLRDAGIDFIYFDSTNHPQAGSEPAPGPTSGQRMVLQPLDRLLAVWRTVPGAPKVVPWVSVPADRRMDMIDAVAARVEAYPDLQFIYEGKPLMLIVDNTHPQLLLDEARYAEFEQRFTLRRMWAYTSGTAKWSFMNTCSDTWSFKAYGATTPCNQGGAVKDGAMEQIPIAMAYQRHAMSDTAGETIPRFGGRTFQRQFDYLHANPTTPIALIASWNEWLAIRLCRRPDGQASGNPAECSDQSPVFVDTWDQEFSKDIEPVAGPMNDFYYRLLRGCITLYKQGRPCSFGAPGQSRGPMVDFTGDPFADYADHYAPDGTFWVHRSNGNNTFDSAAFAEGRTDAGAGWDILVGDFTGDGRADYASYHSSGSLWVHRNRAITGNQAFVGPDYGSDTVIAGSLAEPIAGDFDGDRKADIMVRDLMTGQLSIRRNRCPSGVEVCGGGMFPEWVQNAGTSMIGPEWRILVADFDGDRLADFADHHVPSGQLWIHPMRADGTFDPVSRGYANTADGSTDWDVNVGDYTGDGRADFADVLRTGPYAGMMWIHPASANMTFGGDWTPTPWRVASAPPGMHLLGQRTQ